MTDQREEEEKVFFALFVSLILCLHLVIIIQGFLTTISLLFEYIETNGLHTKDKDKESQQIQRSSKRISSMGASKKSVSFGCVRRAPWFPTTPTLDNRKHDALALNGSSSSSSSSTSSAIEGSENLGLFSDPSSLSAAMISLYTGNFEEVKCYF